MKPKKIIRRKKRKDHFFWKKLLFLLLFVCMTTFVIGAVAVSGQTAAPASAGAPKPPVVISREAQELARHLDKRLQAKAKKGGSALTDVLVVMAKGAPSPKNLLRSLRVKLKADPGHDFCVGRVRTDQINKLATSAGVVFAADNGKRTPPPVPDKPKRSKAKVKAETKKASARLKAATKAGIVKAWRRTFDKQGRQKRSSRKETAAGGGQPTGWFDVGPSHRSSYAWAKGYTGSGVRVGVADDGLDFAHPDLQGTQAIVTDTASAYYGWPMAYDPYSTLLYAIDQTYGTTLTASGYGWFSSTETTITTGAAVLFDGKTYDTRVGSKSGALRIGYIWDENLFVYWYGEFPAILVSDETTPGVYDTVYVDLDFNQDFTDDKPCTKASPISYLDFWNSADSTLGADGFADLSGGMVYYIADGTNHPPGYDLHFSGGTPPEAGALVCFMGGLDLDSSHGTFCGSNVAGQGHIDGASYYDGAYPSFKTPHPPTSTLTDGIVQGAGRDVELVGISDIYYSFSSSTLMAYDFASFGLDGTESTGDELQVLSNSYGDSATDNDEWDFPSRYVTLLNETSASSTSFLFSTGNGGPGYGTNSPPSPSTGISVGASTQMGACGGDWDSIDTTDQVRFGDVIPWSNRGPTAMGHLAPHIVADGAYSSGATMLNYTFGDGWTAWEIWGGTSRSTPVAAGNLALIYQAFKASNGRWPTWEEARDIMMSGATDLNYDTLVQGAGSVNAEQSVDIAAGLGGLLVSPEVWYPGDWRGSKAEAFSEIMAPGETDISTMTVKNCGTTTATVNVSDAWYQRTFTSTTVVTLDPTKESDYSFNRPDYLKDLTGTIPADTELMVIRMAFPFSQMNPPSDYDPISTNQVRVLVYDWTDRNSDGNLWTDTNGNDHVNAGEIDADEYMRYAYGFEAGTTNEVRVQKPATRSHDGFFLGLQHRQRYNNNPVTVKIEISCWKRADWSWLAVEPASFDLSPGAEQTLSATMTVPGSAPLGVYEGQIRVADTTHTTVMPVVVTVAGNDDNITFGGSDPYGTLMPNNKVFGCQDWEWREESGDWRFFLTDVPDTTPLPPGANWLVHTTWDTTPPTDLDSLIYGPVTADWTPASIFGPYDLGFKGGSVNTNLGGGVWTFQTATGGSVEWASGPLTTGLNELMIHNVMYNGATIDTTFSGETGMIAVDPPSVSLETTVSTGTQALAVCSSLALPDATAIAYGLTARYETTQTIGQDQTWTYNKILTAAGYLEAETFNETSDIDLYVEWWSGSGWVLIGASETGSGNEYVKVQLPANGSYRIEVYGYSVSGGTDQFKIRVSSPMGYNISTRNVPTGSVSPDTTFTINADWSKPRTTLAERESTHDGVIFLGPRAAKTAIEIPFTLGYPFGIISQNPAPGATNFNRLTPVSVTFSKRLTTSTINSSTFYLQKDASTLSGSVSYNDTSATASLTVPGLATDTTYTAVLTGVIRSRTGEALPTTTWTFMTDDTQKPTGTVVINNGDASTTSTAVTLTLSATDPVPGSGVSKMMISNSPTFSGVSWENYLTVKPWTIPGGSGLKTVYVKFKDNAGNISDVYSDSITANVNSIYYFPWYDCLYMKTWILVGNPETTASVHASIYLAGSLKETKTLAPGESYYAYYSSDIGGPVKILSDKPVFTTQRSIFGDSFCEVAGISDSTFDTKYYYPWYDCLYMKTWILVGNPQSTSVSVDIYLGGTKRETRTLAAGESYYAYYSGDIGGPVKIVSSQPVFTTQRSIYATSFCEVSGISNVTLDQTYYFPWYDCLYMKTWILVGNPQTSPVAVNIYLGGAFKESRSLAAGESYYAYYSGDIGGPVKITSTQPIFATQRSLYGPSFCEVPGISNYSLASKYYFPWYDCLYMKTWILVGNPQTSPVAVDIYLGGAFKESRSLAAGESYYAYYSGDIGGPVKIVSSQPIFSTQRSIYASSFWEIGGINVP